MKRIHSLLRPQTGSLGLRGIALALGLLFGALLLPLIGEEPAADAPTTPPPPQSDPAELEAASPSDAEGSKLYSGDPLRVLVVTGGCCHNYAFQTEAMTNGVGSQVDVEWTIEHKGGKGTAYKSELYEDPDWAKDFDVVVHNECFAKTSDAAYVKKVVAGHATNGTPAVVVHCAMHTYRDAKGGDWQNFLGVTSYKHEHQSKYAVAVVKPGHPIMERFPNDWVTPKDELYIVDKVWPGAEVLATSKSEKSGKEHPVIWANTHEGTRVFGTTYGHSDATFRDPVFLDLLAQGVVWAAGKDADSAKE